MMLDAEEGKKDKEAVTLRYTHTCTPPAHTCKHTHTHTPLLKAPLPGHDIEPVLVDLILGGSKVPVTPQRVHEYVRWVVYLKITRTASCTKEPTLQYVMFCCLFVYLFVCLCVCFVL